MAMVTFLIASALMAVVLLLDVLIGHYSRVSEFRKKEDEVLRIAYALCRRPEIAEPADSGTVCKQFLDDFMRVDPNLFSVANRPAVEQVRSFLLRTADTAQHEQLNVGLSTEYGLAVTPSEKDSVPIAEHVTSIASLVNTVAARQHYVLLSELTLFTDDPPGLSLLTMRPMWQRLTVLLCVLPVHIVKGMAFAFYGFAIMVAGMLYQDSENTRIRKRGRTTGGEYYGRSWLFYLGCIAMLGSCGALYDPLYITLRVCIPSWGTQLCFLLSIVTMIGILVGIVALCPSATKRQRERDLPFRELLR